MFTDHLVCVVARDNPRLTDGGLSLERLQEMPHAVAEFGAAGERKRPLEVEMERVGVVDRPILVQVTSLLTLPFALGAMVVIAAAFALRPSRFVYFS